MLGFKLHLLQGLHLRLSALDYYGRLKFRAFILLVVSIFLGCTPSADLSEEEKLSENESASQFIVMDQGYNVTPAPIKALNQDKTRGQVNDYWKIERFRNYTFKVCLNDRHRALSLRNQRFSINSLQGRQEKATGEDGCFRWVETIEYNYFADATYIVLERKLKGIGSYKGIFNLEIAINPWSERDKTGAEVVFLKPKRGFLAESILVRGSFQELQKALFGTGQKKSLFLESIHMQLKEDTPMEPSRFSFWLRKGLLQVRALNIKGEDNLIPIQSGGHFRVFSRVLQYSSISGKLDSIDKLLSLPAPSVILNAKGRIDQSHSNQVSIDKYIHIQTPKYLSRNWDEEVGWVALRVQPLNFPYGNFFKQFEGIYDLGLLTSLHSGTVAKISPLETKKYSTMVHNSESVFDKIFASAQIRNGQFMTQTQVRAISEGKGRKVRVFEKYDFSDMRPNFEEVLRGESVTTRGIAFRVQTCLTKRFNGARPPLDEPFEVTVIDKETNSKTVYNLKIVGEDRCLNFVHKVWFKHFRLETLFHFDLHIKEVTTNLIVTKSRGISINPWDTGWTFGRDFIHLSDDYIRQIEEQGGIRSRFFLPSYNYYTLRFRYAIDQFLNLKVKKTVLLHLRPMMVRYHSRMQGRFGLFKLRDGIYLMKVAVEKKYLDPSENVTIVSSEDEIAVDTDLIAAQKTILRRDDLSQRHHLSIVKRLVHVIDGQIIAPVEIAVEDLRIMRIRAQLMVQLEPVEEWRHYMVKLYNDFYERQLREVKKNNMLLSTEAYERLNSEKISNIQKIIELMSINERRVHELIERKYKQEVKEDKVYSFNNQRYRGCYGVPEIRWDDIFKEFHLNHPRLSELGYSNLSERDKKLTSEVQREKVEEETERIDENEEEGVKEARKRRTRWSKPMKYYGLAGVQDQESSRKKDKVLCYRPYNAVHPLILNDFVNASLEPIPGLDLDVFVDRPESSALHKETFFGPVTPT